jgi:hypothetical protein
MEARDILIYEWRKAGCSFESRRTGLDSVGLVEAAKRGVQVVGRHGT